MYAAEFAGLPVNKAAHNEALRRMLNNRSKGAVEFKHQNISAVLVEAGYAYIDGYKPRYNYQELLRDVVLDRLERDPRIARVTAEVVGAPVAPAFVGGDWQSLIVDPPRSERKRAVAERRIASVRPMRSVNYLEQEARNSALGRAGEVFVLEVEQRRLHSLGAKKLADRIEHVARTQGDGLGYDILSYETSGRERLIEVKTTRFGSMTPFFATANEVKVSVDTADSYHLYRVFKYGDDPKLFVLSGSLRRTTILDPTAFRATLP